MFEFTFTVKLTLGLSFCKNKKLTPTFFFFVHLFALLQKTLNLLLKIFKYYFTMSLETFQFVLENILYVSVSSLANFLNNKFFGRTVLNYFITLKAVKLF